MSCVCVCVCLLSHISPMERLFVLKTLSRTQRATKVKKFVGFSLKPLRCRDPALPPLYGHAYSRPFFSCTRMRISRVYTRMIHRRGFSTLVLFIHAVMLCESAQRYRALMVILRLHRTQNMILTEMLSPCIFHTSETYQILSPVLFQQFTASLFLQL